MSEDRKDDAQQTGGGIADLPASDQELNEEQGGGSGARPALPPPEGGRAMPSPEATQPSPGAGGQPSPGGDAARAIPPDPSDPEG